MILKVLAGMVGTVAVAGVVVFSEGAISVRVLQKRHEGHHIRLVLPAMLVPLGMSFVPNAKLQQASEEVRPWLPTIEVATRELARCPDGVFVAVKGPHEQVSIAKRGGALQIDVDSEEETVHVSVPLGMMHRVVRRLEAIGPAS